MDWLVSNKMILSAYPPHYQLSKSEIEKGKQLRRKCGALLMRYTSEYDKYAYSEWWYLIKDSSSDYSYLKSEDRYEINKGLKRNHSEKLDLQAQCNNIYECYLKAIGRYRNAADPITKDCFQLQIENDAKDKTIEYIGVYSGKDGNLAGYSKNYIFKDYVSYSAVKLNPEYLKDGASAALFQFMNERYIDGQKKRYVSDGERSIRHETNIQKYLEKYFGFRKAYCRLNVIYANYYKPLIKILYKSRRILDIANSYIDIRIINDLKALVELERVQRSFRYDYPAGRRSS
jgi:hypothetical protein